MDTTGVEEALVRSGDDYATVAAVGQSGASDAEDERKVIEYYIAVVQEARQEAKLYPDPETAVQKILQEKLNAISEQILTHINEKYTKPQSLPI